MDHSFPVAEVAEVAELVEAPKRRSVEAAAPTHSVAEPVEAPCRSDLPQATDLVFSVAELVEATSSKSRHPNTKNKYTILR